VEDLCLDFTLPGHPEWELKVDISPSPSGQLLSLKNNISCIQAGGKDIPLTVWNMEEYLEKVVDAYLCSGIARQRERLLKGLEEVFPPSALLSFSASELHTLICGLPDDSQHWTLQGTIIVVSGPFVNLSTFFACSADGEYQNRSWIS